MKKNLFIILPLFCFFLQLLTSGHAKGADHEEIREIAKRAEFEHIDLQPYEGSPADETYLRNYILDLASRTYGVDRRIFLTPTLLSTTLLRDLVNKVNAQAPENNSLDALASRHELQNIPRMDIAEMWRYPSWGACGHVSFSLYNIYKSLKFKTRRIDSINGLVGIRTFPNRYRDSHVTTEVYLADLKRYIIQDPLLNSWIENDAGRILDFIETRKTIATGKNLPLFRTLPFAFPLPRKIVIFDEVPDNFTKFNKVYFIKSSYNLVWKLTSFDGTNEHFFPLGAYFGKDLNPHIIPKRKPLPSEDTYKAMDKIRTCHTQGLNLQDCIASIKTEKFVAGFQSGTSRFITFLINHDYYTFDYNKMRTLDGALDQLVIAAMQNKLPPDLQDTLLSPIDLVAPNGQTYIW